MERKDSSGMRAEHIDQWLQETRDGSLETIMSPWGEGLDLSQPRAKEIIGNVVKYQELLLLYTCAMKEVRTKFDVLNTEFNVRDQRNPISSVSTRLKSMASIMEKLNRRGLPLTLESME